MEMNLTENMKNIVAKGIQTDVNSLFSGPGYITEKLYMLLQLYLQNNKNWNPSLELLQCFTDLKENSMLPSGAYLQMLASRVALDSQNRLVLRENGKIILPLEHFVNAIMLKHVSGPHGVHLNVEGTIRAVIESYTIGKENFGMEKELIMEVVQNCPNPTCRYKSQLEITQSHAKPTYIPEVQPPVPATTTASNLTITTTSNDNNSTLTSMAPPPQPPLTVSMTPPSRPLSRSPSQPPSRPPSVDLTSAFESIATSSSSSSSNGNGNGNSKVSPPTPSPPPNSTPLPPPSPKPPPTPKPLTARQQQQNKLADFLKANLENFDKVVSDPLIDGSSSDDGKRQDAGQEKIVKLFGEIMKNMGRMKSCVRPAMCKPYGKQSEALQKTVIDTIQLVQSLRSFLPPPHIAVSSWKNEDKHSRLERKSTANIMPVNANTGAASVSLVSSGIGTTMTSSVATSTTLLPNSNAIASTATVNNVATRVNASTNATAEELNDAAALRTK